jgi:alanine dehydrogenase
VLIPGERAPILITRDMVRSMRPGSLIIDFSIDQGGCVETSRPSTLRDPVYIVDGVLHHCVPNITSIVSRTASHALTNAALPYLLSIGDQGLDGALRQSSALVKGVKLYRGKIASQRLAVALGREVEVDLAAALALFQDAEGTGS